MKFFQTQLILKVEKNFKIKKIIKKKIGYFGSIYHSRGIPLIIKLSKIDKNNDYFIYGGSKHDVKKINTHKSENLKINSQISYKEVKKLIKKNGYFAYALHKKSNFFWRSW